MEFLASYGITVERVITDNGLPTDQRSTRSPAARTASDTSALALGVGPEQVVQPCDGWLAADGSVAAVMVVGEQPAAEHRGGSDARLPVGLRSVRRSSGQPPAARDCPGVPLGIPATPRPPVPAVFLFFSNRLGCMGSLLVSAILTLVLLLILGVL